MKLNNWGLIQAQNDMYIKDTKLSVDSVPVLQFAP
jgi:hypothetical protein